MTHPTSAAATIGPDSEAGATPRSRAWVLPRAVLAAAVGGVFVWFYYARYAPTVWSDFDQIWLGARALLHGKDPYEGISRGDFPWPLYYPIPALFFGLPLAGFPLPVARVFFGAATAGLCAYAIFRWRPFAWPLLCTGPFVYALQRGQWSPLLVASVFLPALGAVLSAKPTIGAAVFAYRPTRAAVTGCFALGLIALIWYPDWPVRWIESGRGTHHLVPPAFLPGGWLLLAGLLRWRRPEARLLGVLALVPQTSSMYELVPLGLIPRNRREALVLALAFNVLYVATFTLHGRPLTPADIGPDYFPGTWIPTLVLAYLPALWLVLRPFPLWHRPPELAGWPSWRRKAYVTLWVLVLGVIALWCVGGAWFMWTYVLPPMFSLLVS